MPRKRKTQSGMTAQPIQAVPGTGYGQGIKQEQFARQMPAPNVRAGAGRPPVSAPMRPQASSSTAPAAQPPQPVAQQMGGSQAPDLMAIAQKMRGETGLLQAPTARPNEPVTAGMNYGPGPGREALAQPYGSPLADMMMQLARATGDPYFNDLAQRSRV
jgi:hypothetical protein